MRKTKDASCAGADRLWIVDTRCVRKADTTGCAEGFGNTENRSDISGILQLRQDDHWSGGTLKEIRKIERSGAHQSDNALRGLRILDLLECLGIERINRCVSSRVIDDRVASYE